MPEEAQMSEAEWNKLVDEHVEELNRKKGMVMIPPQPYELPEVEYIMGINNRTVTEDLIRHYAYAVGDANPLWRDPNYAQSTRWGGIIAPPTFEYCIANCDAGGVPPGGTFILPGFNLFAAGNKHEYFGVIRPGDEFHIVDKYLGPQEKEVKGKSYRLFTDMGQRTYINQRDEVVAVATSRRIMTGTPPGQMGDTQEALYKGIERRHFSKKELDALHRHYNDELAGKNRRGSEVRYWEDVSEGEEIPTVIKGPLDTSDACSGMLVEYAYAFAIKWSVMRQDVSAYPVDPETGEYRYRRDWHFDDAMARLCGVPYAFQIGKYSEMLLSHVVTNWMGDDGFVKALDYQLRGVNINGNMNWLKGRVARKYVENGEHLVDLDVRAETQDGVVVTKGTATVRLVSRED